ncbi:malonyl-ACP O-methyltransferase BioC [Candidatus Pantoea persica]|uniref:malonyl-ACP O-methyltransferase BioC n=1 Tax=Candidatus Pantoea persica TaxID=2518128 RepID=UPI00215D9F4E|nr:malonyl-ACP O-methyltransferase BioC [Candidatus Pantoea persica]MBA2815131.1 Malonyl-CoA O-methyltransferase BioC [Candidatus Pantoea persica]
MTRQVNKEAVARAFGRAAGHYEQHAELQRRCGDALLALAPAVAGGDLLDAGCGTGWYSRQWRQRGQRVVALDLSPQMLQQARSLDAVTCYLAGDIDALPLADQSIDLVWSNLAVQWSSDLRTALRQFARVLRPEGTMLFSTLLAGSLQEVHDAWRPLGAEEHANRFLTEAEVRAAGDGLNLRFIPQTQVMHFPSALSAMQSLKGIGATHLHQGRDGSPLTRQRLARLEALWPRDVQGCRLTYQLLLGVTQR